MLFSNFKIRNEQQTRLARLSQSFINDLNQDNRGFLYVATGNGLSVYGGNTFKIFTKEILSEECSLGLITYDFSKEL